jgi:hypothetical protein
LYLQFPSTPDSGGWGGGGGGGGERHGNGFFIFYFHDSIAPTGGEARKAT